MWDVLKCMGCGGDKKKEVDSAFWRGPGQTLDPFSVGFFFLACTLHLGPLGPAPSKSTDTMAHIACFYARCKHAISRPRLFFVKGNRIEVREQKTKR